MEQKIKALENEVGKLNQRLNELEERLTGHVQLRKHKIEPVPVEKLPRHGAAQGPEAAVAGFVPLKDAGTPNRGLLDPGKGAGARVPGSLEPPKEC